MKTLLSIMILAGIALLFNACNKKSDTTEVALIVDVTDKQAHYPNKNEILHLFHLENNKWNGAILHVTTISDISMNATEMARLEPANEWMGNKLKRNKDVTLFNQHARDIITDTTNIKTGKNNSSIYLPIANELNILAKSTSQMKTLIIYSDLMENTNDVSFYRQKDLTLLKTKPEAIKERLEKLSELPSLSGIEIYLIYQPDNIKNDELFRLTSSMYKELLESKGGKVTISTNLGN